MSKEENERRENLANEKEPRSEENAEPIDEAQGSPEDPGTIEGPETEAVEEEPEETAALEDSDFPEFLEELERVKKERDEYLEALQRIKAEFENYRKRQERDRARLTQVATERLVTELLPVMDNFERAIESGGDIREGVKATRDQLASVLEQEGLVVVASDGQHFDPNVHEAVMGQPSEEHEEGTILQTFQRGYVLNGKPIRPAKVVVARQE